MEKQYDYHLGAHLLNNPNFGMIKETIKPNCVVQPLLELYTLKNVQKGEELFISYNRK